MSDIESAAHEFASAKVGQYISKFVGRAVLARAADNVYQRAYMLYMSRANVNRL